MRKSFGIVTMLLLLALSCSTLVACGALDNGENNGGDEHTHSYGEWQIVEATCAVAGSKTKKCNCGSEVIEKIDATGIHTYNNWTVVTASTCSVAGVKKAKCSCGSEVIEKTDATGVHTYGDWTVVTDSTCTVAGVKKAKCFCGNEKTESVEVLPHISNGQWQWLEDDSKAYNVSGCTVCNSGTVKVEVAKGLQYAMNSVVGIGSCNNSNIVIPYASDSNERITIIDDSAFYNLHIQSVIIPEGVVKIGNNAFYNNYYLATVSIPDSVKYIGGYAFYDCSNLVEINIPEGGGYQKFGMAPFRNARN